MNIDLQVWILVDLFLLRTEMEDAQPGKASQKCKKDERVVSSWHIQINPEECTLHPARNGLTAAIRL